MRLQLGALFFLLKNHQNSTYEFQFNFIHAKFSNFGFIAC